MKPFEIIEKIQNEYLNIQLYRGVYKNIELAENEVLDKNLFEFEKTFIETYWYLPSFTSFCKKATKHSRLAKELSFEKLNNQALIFRDKKTCISYLDSFFMLWLLINIKKDIWGIIETHQKSTGELFYSVGMELMNIHDEYLETIEVYKNSDVGTNKLVYQL